ncbi:ly6/PLAUR domain-containing protein 8-like [Kryptolebias marmoratus]|uniref:Ly6/PLAUR domain-containing protein 8-like n=1 Tax=Kryptolebias marmoratus TaxID=37003 RepID=A0A3Q3B0L6_KRYMA|nr:ly6/PLAUR domain-containing protein 8-like [Kryptolebias marmoratus]
MFFFTLVLGIWLLPKANSLTCNKCTYEDSGNCINTTTNCSNETYQCGETRLATYLGGFKHSDVKTTGCISAQECFDASINVGIGKVVYKSQCCNGELCNTRHVPDFNISLNGKKCFSCYEGDCSRKLSCKGDEDHCITTTLNQGEQRLTMKGCASNSTCQDNIPALLKQYVEFNISCCQGDFCNDASSTRADLLLLLVLLSSLILFW